jgi:hypothetical protein
MEVRTIILAMTSIGVIVAVGDRLLGTLGKLELANLLNIAGFSGLGLMALGLVYKLLQLLGTI